MTNIYSTVYINKFKKQMIFLNSDQNKVKTFNCMKGVSKMLKRDLIFLPMCKFQSVKKIVEIKLI